MWYPNKIMRAVDECLTGYEYRAGEYAHPRKLRNSGISGSHVSGYTPIYTPMYKTCRRPPAGYILAQTPLWQLAPSYIDQPQAVYAFQYLQADGLLQRQNWVQAAHELNWKLMWPELTREGPTLGSYQAFGQGWLQASSLGKSVPFFGASTEVLNPWTSSAHGSNRRDMNSSFILATKHHPELLDTYRDVAASRKSGSPAYKLELLPAPAQAIPMPKRMKQRGR